MQGKVSSDSVQLYYLSLASGVKVSRYTLYSDIAGVVENSPLTVTLESESGPIRTTGIMASGFSRVFEPGLFISNRDSWVGFSF